MKRTNSLKNKICQNSQEKIDNLNRPVCIKEIESISSLPNQKASGPDELNGEFCQTLKDKIMSLFPENGSGGTAPWLVWVQCCPDTRSRQRQCKKTTDQNHSWTQRIPQQNISKSTKWIYSKYAGLVQHSKINQCDPSDQQAKKGRSYISWSEKGIWQNLTLFMINQK